MSLRRSFFVAGALILFLLLLFGCTASSFATFKVKDNSQVCKIDGKPVIRMYSTSFCPHCNSIKDTYDSIAKEYIAQGKIVAYHWQWIFDNENKLIGIDDLLTDNYEGSISEEEAQLFHTFNPEESVPTFVFGCKYYRIGNGYENGGVVDTNKEAAEFRAVIEKLLTE